MINRGKRLISAFCIAITSMVVLHPAEAQQETWTEIASTPLAVATVEKTLFTIPGRNGPFLHIRIINRSNHSIGFEGSDPLFRIAECFDSNIPDPTIVFSKFGVHMAHLRPLSEDDQKSLKNKFLNPHAPESGSMHLIVEGTSYQYYVSCRANSEVPSPEAHRPKYMVLLVSGGAAITDGEGVQELRCNKTVALRRPIQTQELLLDNSQKERVID